MNKCSIDRHCRGFTLVEAAITMAVTATLAATAVPHFKASLDRQHLTQAINELQLSIELGRSEAMARGQRVVLAPQQAGNWGSGWHLYRDDNNNGERDDAEPLLQVFAGPDAHVAVHAWGAPANAVLSFNEDGFIRRAGSNGLAMGGISLNVDGQVRTLCFSATRTRTTTADHCN